MRHSQRGFPEPPRLARRRRIRIALLIAGLCAAAVCTPYVVSWALDQDRNGTRLLTAAQARVVVADPTAGIENRRRAIHRLNKSIQGNIAAMKTAAQNPELAPRIASHFRTFRLQMEVK